MSPPIRRPDVDVAVVGAGAAGLTAALRAAEGGARVTLLNAHPRIGLKILMSGGTRCNVTHREVSERDFHGGSRHFVANVLRAFTPAETLEWFESLGVRLKFEDTGKYFPETDQAETVLDALVRAVERAGVEVRAGVRVIRLERVAGESVQARADEGAAKPGGRSGTRAKAGAGSERAEAKKTAGVGKRSTGAESRPPFRLGIQRVDESAAFSPVSAIGRTKWEEAESEPEEWLEAGSVVLATGGLSFPRTGSDGTGFALAQSLGHTILPTLPALTPLTSEDPICRELQGVSLDAELMLWEDDERTQTVRGSLLFAHFGCTGPAALNLSRHWLKATQSARGADEVRVTTRFLPRLAVETATRQWLAAAKDPQVTVRRYFGEWLPDRLVVHLCGEARVSPSLPLAQVPRPLRAALLGRLLERPLPVTGTLGYEKAEVTAGGVKLSEIDPKTLQSRLAPGIHLCGEMLDVDGKLGGFNFQWAWSSGTVAGRSAVR